VSGHELPRFIFLIYDFFDLQELLSPGCLIVAASWMLAAKFKEQKPKRKKDTCPPT
jgi:hypothetical protein